MFVKPPAPRHTLHEQPGQLVIRVPARGHFFPVLFLSVWLIGWAFGEVMVARVLLFDRDQPAFGYVFMTVWFLGWTFGGGLALYTLLWQLRGVEIITVTPTALSVQRAIFGLGRTRHYDMAEIRRLRLAAPTYSYGDHRSSWAAWGMGEGFLAFDYGAKTYRLGSGLDEAEAHMILQHIAARHPALAAVGG